MSVDYVDADKNPVQAQQLGVQQSGTIVLQYAGRTEKVTTNDEQAITNGIKKVVEGKAKKIYFVQGHGEHDTTGSDQRGYSGIASALKDDNFDVATLTLAQEGKVPDDATVVVIAGPARDYLGPELEALRAYLKRGGKLLMTLDPPEKADAPPLTGLLDLAKEWGFDVGDNVVVDASGMGQLIRAGPETPIAMPAPTSHPITDHFELMTAFPLTRSVTPVSGGVNGHVPQTLLQTSPRSWAETDLKTMYASGRAEPNPDKGDVAGPVPIAGAVSAAADAAPAPAAEGTGPAPTAAKPETRMVVVGDSDFASNGALGITGNRDLYLNMTNWLALQENLIAIRPREAQDRRVTLTQDQMQRIFYLTVYMIPGLLILNGLRVWWRRR